MANVLQYSLGLATGNFIPGARAAAVALGTLTGIGLNLNGIFREIADGGRLFDLSKRTSEGVRSLFSMEHAFNDVGVSSANVATLILQTQKAIGGLDEMGQPTNDTFKQLGLSVSDLKELNAPQQIQAIGAALNKLPKDEAANLAAKIAGRGGAGDLLQIARSSEDFAAALEKAAPIAAIVARNAAAFDKIGDTMAEIRLHSRGFFAGLAEGMAPGIQSVLDALNNIDLTGFGLRIGNVFSGLTQAFHEQRLGEVFELSLKAGIQGGSNFMLEKIAEWSEAVRKAFSQEKGTGPNPILSGTLGTGAGLLALWNEIGGKIGIPGAQQKADERFDQAMRLFGEAGIGDGLLSQMTEPLLLGGKNKFAEDLKKLMGELAGRAPKGVEAIPNAEQGGVGLTGKAKAGKTSVQANELERIGAMFNFGGSSAIDHTRRTADNTGRSVQVLERISKKLDRVAAPPDFRNVA